MTHQVPTNCPVCAHALVIARVSCDHCGTAIEGRFGLGRLGRLSREQLEFVEVFLDARGKIKDVEAALGISYPTVVARLEQVVSALGPKSSKSEAHARATHASTDDVLDALAKGELTPEAAAAQLKAHAKKKR